jgi:hypothetical protein
MTLLNYAHGAGVALDDQTDSMRFTCRGPDVIHCKVMASKCQVNDFDTSWMFGIDSDHALHPNRYHGDSCAAEESRVPTEWEKTHLLMSEDSNPSQDVVCNGDQRDDEVTN